MAWGLACHHQSKEISMTEQQAIYTFTSHIEGKNAKVSVFPDRLEWIKPRGISAGKITAGLATGGLSIFATGVKNGKTGTEMIPIKSISSVTTKRDGLLNTLVSVITSGNTIDFRVSHTEAAAMKEVLTRLMLAPASAPVAAAPVAPAPAVVAAPDIAGQLTQLGSLRDAGILTQEEFDTKKAELLARF
jgi:hypothetical protein